MSTPSWSTWREFVLSASGVAMELALGRRHTASSSQPSAGGSVSLLLVRWLAIVSAAYRSSGGPLAYPLGGRYHLSHGMSNAVMLPHVMKANAEVSRERFVDIASAMKLEIQGHSTEDIVAQVLDAIEKICRDVEIPATLKHFGIPEQDIQTLAVEASKVTRLLRNNPRKLTVDEIEEIYRQAF